VDVHVITSQQLYDDPSRQLPAKAIMGGISAAMLEDNPLVVGSPYPLLPIWSTVTLKFISRVTILFSTGSPAPKLNPPAIPHI
jgi:hypothetical protein